MFGGLLTVPDDEELEWTVLVSVRFTLQMKRDHNLVGEGGKRTALSINIYMTTLTRR